MIKGTLSLLYLLLTNNSKRISLFDDVTGPESFKIFGEKMPDFPLIPASKGFCLSLESSLKNFKGALKAKNLL